MIERDEFRRMAQVALDASKADHAIVSLGDSKGGTTRFANNQIVQNVNTRRYSLSVSVAFGARRGSSSTTDLSDGSIAATVQRAERIARVSPPDPESMPPLPEQQYTWRSTFNAATAKAGPQRLIDEAAESIKLCKSAGLQGAGIVSAYVSASGVAADTGLFAYEQRSRAEFSLTATGPDSSGWVKNADRSIDELGVVEGSRIAIHKARRSASPKEIPAGRYTVILEPAAVAGLLGPIQWTLDAKGYYRGTSAFSGKLGERVIDERLTLQNRPDEARLLGNSFSGSGLPSDDRVWVDKGVLKELSYDRYTAKQHGVAPSYGLDAPHLSGPDPVASTDDLIRGTERGILVTNFWYIRFVNPTDLTLTGMTRDGTFLVEDGEIRHGLINFRWHESPLRAFNQVDAYTAPQGAITMERTKMLLPAMRLRDFNFSSVTRF